MNEWGDISLCGNSESLSGSEIPGGLHDLDVAWLPRSSDLTSF